MDQNEELVEYMADETAVVDQAVETAVDTTVEESSGQESAAPAPKPYSERIAALKGKARDHYKLTGELDVAEQLQSPAADSTDTQSGAGDTAQTEAASDPVVKEQPKGRDRDWNKVREKAASLERDNIALKAKLEVYERERAGSGQSAPAKPADTVAQTEGDERPDFPDIGEFDDQAKYKQAVKDWKKSDSDWVKRQLDNRFTGERQQQQYQQSTQKWESQVSAAKQVHKDFEAVAFSDSVPVTYTALGVIQGMADGALRSYALGKNIPEAQRIADLTHMPGEDKFQSHADFMKWVKSDPDRAMLYGEKLATAKAEISKLQVSTTKQAAPQRKPLKEVIAGSQTPSAEVNVDATSQPVVNPIQEALKRGDFSTYKRLQNAEDLRDRNGR